MRWWTPTTVASGQPDTRPEDAVLIGNEPADVMGDALDKINGIYESKWGRPPQKDEGVALFNFVYKARGYKNLPPPETEG